MLWMFGQINPPCRCWATCSSAKWLISLLSYCARSVRWWRVIAVTLNLLMLGTLLLTLPRKPRNVVTALLLC